MRTAACLMLSGLVAGLALAPAGAAAAKRHCGPASAHTVKSSKFGRVYNRRGYVYACSHSGGKPHRLGRKYDCGSSSSCGGVDIVKLTGAYVGFTLFESDGNVARSLVAVHRLRSGRTLHEFTEGGVEENATTAAMVLKPNGSVGWIEGVLRLPRVPASKGVHRYDTTGHALLDMGDDIDSLAVHGSVMSWVNAGQAKSALN